MIQRFIKHCLSTDLRCWLILAIIMQFGCPANNGRVRGDDPPATVTTQPTSVTASAEVKQVLQRMEKARERITDLKTEVEYKVEQLIKENPDDPGSVQNYLGEIKYSTRNQQILSEIYFREWNDGTRRFREQTWYLFDGRWLTEAKEKTRTVIRRELVAEGESIDVFKIGEGPFPLPFGQKQADMLAEFEIEYQPSAAGDPVGTDHLVCTPKTNTQLADRFSRIELFVSGDDAASSAGIPVKIVVHNIKQATLDTAIFNNLKINPGLSEGDFKLPPLVNSWEQIVEPLKPSDK